MCMFTIPSIGEIGALKVYRIQQVWLFLAVLLLASCQPITAVDDLQLENDAVNDSGVVVESAVAEHNDATVIDMSDAATAVDVDIKESETDATESAVSEFDRSEPSEIEPAQIESVDSELVEKGMAVYRAQYCGTCHQLSAAGTTGTFGPSHDGAVSMAQEHLQDPRYGGEAATIAEYLYESLVDPRAYFVEGYVGSSHSMPQYTHLSEEELQALVALLMAQE